MALSGTITGKADNTNYTLTCDWSATQSISNNTSTITAKVYLQAPSGWSTASSYWNCTINGTQVTTNKSVTVSSTKVLLGTRTWTVTHGSNGALSTSISFSYSNGLTSAGTYTTKSGSGSATVTLNTIPRTSSFTLSSSSLNMGSAQTVTISRASSSFTHTVQYTFGGSTTTAATKSTATTISFTPPTSLASQVPSATSGTCTVKVTTYNGDTSIGSASKTFTLNVPSSIVPSVSVATTINNALGGLAIAGKSTVKVTPTGSGSNGSSISSYTYSGGGLSGTGSSKTTGTLSSGTHTFSVTAKDSRGRTATASKSVTVYAYSAPTCTISAFRANSSGTATADGTYVRLKLNWAVSNPNNANANARTYSVYYKKSSDTSWTTKTSNGTLSAYSGSSTSWDCGGGFETTSSYDFKFTITDSYGSASATCKLSTIAAILDIEKNGVGVGKLREKGVLDIKGHSYIYGTHYFSTDANGHARIGYSNDGLCTFIANGNNNWLRLNDDKTLTYGGYTIYHSGNMSSTEIQASKFTVSSEAKWKKNIQTLDYNAMDLINRTVVYEYELKDNSNTRMIGKKSIGLVIDYETPEEIISEVEILDDSEWDGEEEFIPGKVKQIDKGVDLYAMSSLTWKALQEKDAEIKDLQSRVGHLEALVKQLLEAKN